MCIQIDQRIFQFKPLVHILVGHQLIQTDFRSDQCFLLLHILRTVGIEIHLGLLIVQSGKGTDIEAGLNQSDTFLGQLHRVVEILQTDFLLDKVIILGHQ